MHFIFFNMCQYCEYILISYFTFKYIISLKMDLLFVGLRGLGILIYFLQKLCHCLSCSMPYPGAPFISFISLSTWNFSVCERSKLKETILICSKRHGDLIFASAWVLILFPQYCFILIVNTGES